MCFENVDVKEVDVNVALQAEILVEGSSLRSARMNNGDCLIEELVDGVIEDQGEKQVTEVVIEVQGPAVLGHKLLDKDVSITSQMKVVSSMGSRMVEPKSLDVRKDVEFMVNYMQFFMGCGQAIKKMILWDFKRYKKKVRSLKFLLVLEDKDNLVGQRNSSLSFMA